MTPAEMSALHHATFADTRGWSVAEIENLLGSPHTYAFTQDHGFALTRTVAGESELLTLAVDPAYRRLSIARTLLQTWLSSISDNAETAFLEVAADNTAARALYASLGFEIAATRLGYYARPFGPAIDALVLKRALTCRQTPDSDPQRPESG